MKDEALINDIATLARSIGFTPDDIKPLAESGSSRKYFRLSSGSRTLMGTYNANVEENEAFFYLTQHFGAHHLPVPNILAINESRECYLQTDYGDDTLFHHVQLALASGRYDEATIALFKKALRQLVRFQVLGHQGLDYNKVYPTPCFDLSGVLDDLDYFKYYFVKPHAEIVFNEARLKAEFHALAEEPFGQGIADDADFFVVVHLLTGKRSAAHEVVFIDMEEVGTNLVANDVQVVILSAHHKGVAFAQCLTRSCCQQRGRAVLDVRAGLEPLLVGLSTEASLPLGPVVGLDAQSLEVDGTRAVPFWVDGRQLDIIHYGHHHREGNGQGRAQDVDRGEKLFLANQGEGLSNHFHI